ncbi:MAG: maleylpyruvate isomerase N-terminal domain-containing protein [Pseudonocardiaceae bacterium]
MPTIDRSREAAAFLDARQYTAPEVVSACEGWTAHEVTAHLAAAAAEITCHLEPYLAGEPVPRTRSFEDREPPYRAMGDAELLRRLDVEEEKMRGTIEQVLAREPEVVIPWTTEHAVSVLGQILVRRGHEHDPAPQEDFHVRLRAENASDVRLVVEAGPAQRARFRSHVDQPTLSRIQALLSGYSSPISSRPGGQRSCVLRVVQRRQVVFSPWP